MSARTYARRRRFRFGLRTMFLVVTLLALAAPHGVPLVKEWIDAWRAEQARVAMFAEMAKAIDEARKLGWRPGPDVIIGYRATPEAWVAYWAQLIELRRHIAREPQQ